MKFVYKPVGLIVSIIGARVAMSLFQKLWAVTGGEGDAPEAKDRDRGWREVLVAATMQGAVFGATKALIDRAGATGYQRLTGVWPGREDSKARAA